MEYSENFCASLPLFPLLQVDISVYLIELFCELREDGEVKDLEPGLGLKKEKKSPLLAVPFNFSVP